VAHGNFFMGSLTREAARAHILRGFQQLLSQPTIGFRSLCHVLAQSLTENSSSIFVLFLPT
jgi:hypothetical protein